MKKVTNHPNLTEDQKNQELQAFEKATKELLKVSKPEILKREAEDRKRKKVDK